MPGVFTHGNVRHVVARLPDVHRRDAQRHQPSLRDVRQRRRRYRRADAAAAQTSRTWYRQNPPLPKTNWSQRNNNNYEETGLLVSLNQFADNSQYFLKNFYLKSKRSVLKPKTEGPAAYVFPGDDPRPGRAGRAAARPAAPARRDLARDQGIHRQGAGQVPTRQATDERRDDERSRRARRPIRTGSAIARPKATSGKPRRSWRRAPSPPAPTSFEWTSRSAVWRTRCSTISTWAPDDPQRQPYDDTAWTFPELFNVKATRVTDVERAGCARRAGQR